jgi:ankyrin repeat protein
MTHREIIKNLEELIGHGTPNELVRVRDERSGIPILIPLLTLAVFSYEVGFLRRLLDMGAAVDAGDKELEGGGLTALHYASDLGLDYMVEELIAGGANVNVKNDDGATPLIYAAHGGHLRVVRLLLRAGGDPNIRAKRGAFVTPLLAAIEAQQSDVCLELLDAGADPNLADCTRTTPLMEAARLGDAFIVQQLLSKGALVDRADRLGKTALICACFGDGRVTGVISHLLDHGADWSNKDKSGKTATDHLRTVLQFIEGFPRHAREQ